MTVPTATATENPEEMLSIREKFARAFALVEIGVTVRRACRTAGIGHDTYYRLIKEEARDSDKCAGLAVSEEGPQSQTQAESTSSARPGATANPNMEGR